jgi:hypothetical protein
MKRLAICFLLVFASFAFAGEAWKKFSAADGSFSVSFPLSPMVKRSNQTIKGRQVPTEMAVVGSNDRAYVAIRMDFSKFGELKGQEETFLDFGVAGLTKEKGYDILSQDKFQIKGSMGRHVVLRKEKMEQQVYVVCKGNQTIMIIAAGMPGKTDDSEAKKFISSFKLN